MADFEQASAEAQKPVTDVLIEIAHIWSDLGLSAEKTKHRVRAISAVLEVAAQGLLEMEKKMASDAGEDLARFKKDVSALAVKVGEKLKVKSKRTVCTVFGQLRELEKERERFKALLDKQAEEAKSLSEKIHFEVARLGLSDYAYACESYRIPAELTGIAAVEAGRAKLKEVEMVRDERIAKAQEMRRRVVSLSEEIAEAIGQKPTFRLALKGEMTGFADGVSVLPRTDASELFLKHLGTFQAERDMLILSSAEFADFLEHLECEYLEMLDDVEEAGRESIGVQDCSWKVSLSPSRSPSPVEPPWRADDTGQVRERDQRGRRSQSRDRYQKDLRSQSRRALPQTPPQPPPPPGCDSRDSRSVRLGAKDSRQIDRRPRSYHRRSRSSDARTPWRRCRSGLKSPVRRKVSRETCFEAINSMQGDWMDRKGVTYIVTDKRVRRDDGRTFSLFVDGDVVGWGIKARYYVVPHEYLDKEVRWMDGVKREVAWIWRRPERSGK